MNTAVACTSPRWSPHAPSPAAEKFGRAMLALRTGEQSVYLGWRLLVDDPAGPVFNVYRSTAGGAPERLNAGFLCRVGLLLGGVAAAWLRPRFFCQTALEDDILSDELFPETLLRLRHQPVEAPEEVRRRAVGEVDGHGEGVGLDGCPALQVRRGLDDERLVHQLGFTMNRNERLA